MVSQPYKSRVKRVRAGDNENDTYVGNTVNSLTLELSTV
jgi:hypothetical protein